MRNRIYIAGPMRGYPDWNFPAFDRAAAIWEEAGWQALSPAATCRALGYPTPEGVFELDTLDPVRLRHVMATDIACIFAADALALLDGWEDSTGATVEVSLIQFLGLPIYHAMTREPMSVRVRPWSAAIAESEPHALACPSEPHALACPSGINADEGTWDDCWRQIGTPAAEADRC